MWPQYFIFCVYFLGFLIFILSLIKGLWYNNLNEILTSFVQIISSALTFYALYAGHFFHVWGWN